MTNDWYDRPLDARAAKGGEAGVDGIVRKGGEFEPFYVPRCYMPQVDDMAALVASADAAGVGYSYMPVPVASLKFRQRVDWDAGADIKSVAHSVKPILISRDGIVLDGDHRADARRREKIGMIVATRLDLDFEPAMQWLFGLPSTHTVDGNQ